MQVSGESEGPSPEQRAQKHTFAAQLLLPRRTQLAEAYDLAAELWASHTGVATDRYQVVARAHAKPAIARELAPRLWERYAARGLVPAGWMDEPRRSFVRSDVRIDARTKLTRLFDPAVGDAVPGFTEAMIVAADPRSIASVEELARQAVSAMKPWGAPAPTRVLWRFTEINVPQRVRSHESLPGGQRASWAATHAVGVQRSALDAQGEQTLRAIVGDDRADALRWEGAAVVDFVHWRRWVAAATLGMRVVVPEYVSDPHLRALEGRRFAELPDPFTPLVDLWWLGYGLEAVGTDAIVLLAARAHTPSKPAQAARTRASSRAQTAASVAAAR